MVQVVLARIRWPEAHYVAALRRLVRGSQPSCVERLAPGPSHLSMAQGCSGDSLKQLLSFIDLQASAFTLDLQVCHVVGTVEQDAQAVA